jgi:hypothetical protein
MLRHRHLKKLQADLCSLLDAMEDKDETKNDGPMEEKINF